MAAFLASAAAVVALDQALKAIAEKRQGRVPGLLYRRNPDGGMAGVGLGVGASVLATAAACMIAVSALSDWPLLMSVGLGAALGGALSNFGDQYKRGFVVDYLAIWGDRVLNLGDVAIALGTMAGVVSLFAGAVG